LTQGRGPARKPPSTLTWAGGTYTHVLADEREIDYAELLA
jgi:hypothetical protein